MSYRTHLIFYEDDKNFGDMDSCQIFGNDDYPDELYKELIAQGSVPENFFDKNGYEYGTASLNEDDNDDSFPKDDLPIEIKDFMGFITSLERYVINYGKTTKNNIFDFSTKFEALVKSDNEEGLSDVVESIFQDSYMFETLRIIETCLSKDYIERVSYSDTSEKYKERSNCYRIKDGKKLFLAAY